MRYNQCRDHRCRSSENVACRESLIHNEFPQIHLDIGKHVEMVMKPIDGSENYQVMRTQEYRHLRLDKLNLDFGNRQC
ncbi:unnamed protein product [Hymenolepis diminuta]|uniref:Uncharacterized protein n=1 Tax=Hymenolepis diminuta TaxID=6216 RepID=A0A3P7BAT9_HYMDI|nr:unnamed protein product [Hymenolepis diminuta]